MLITIVLFRTKLVFVSIYTELVLSKTKPMCIIKLNPELILMKNVDSQADLIFVASPPIPPADPYIQYYLGLGHDNDMIMHINHT